MSTAWIQRDEEAMAQAQLPPPGRTKAVQLQTVPPAAKALVDLLARTWSFLQRVVKSQRAKKKNLQVCESVSLGEKRFLAVVHVDQARLLIGGSATSVALLARLDSAASFSTSLKESSEAVPDLR